MGTHASTPAKTAVKIPLLRELLVWPWPQQLVVLWPFVVAYFWPELSIHSFTPSWTFETSDFCLFLSTDIPFSWVFGSPHLVIWLIPRPQMSPALPSSWLDGVLIYDLLGGRSRSAFLLQLSELHYNNGKMEKKQISSDYDALSTSK